MVIWEQSLLMKLAFYATMGGQAGDIGVITNGDSEFEVKDTIKLLGGKIGHIGQVTKGMFSVGDNVTLKVNKQNRVDTGKNHTCNTFITESFKDCIRKSC